MKRISIIAGPGCGKTKRLIDIYLSEKFENRVLISITLAPIKEFTKRLFGKWRREDEINTIYGFLTRALVRNNIIDRDFVFKFLDPYNNEKQKAKLAKKLGLLFDYSSSFETPYHFFLNSPEKLFKTYELAYTIAILLKGDPYYLPFSEISETIYKKIVDDAVSHKWYDYVFVIYDALTNEDANGERITLDKVYKDDIYPISLILIDEAQDLPKIFPKLLGKNVRTLILAGDPFQSIYRFLASTPDYLLSSENLLKFTKSWRFGKNIASLATRILERIREEAKIRFKYWLESEKEDKIVTYFSFSEIEKIIKKIPKDETVAILARSNQLVQEAISFFLSHGFRVMPQKENLKRKVYMLMDIKKKLLKVYQNPFYKNLLPLRKYYNFLPKWLQTEIQKAENMELLELEKTFELKQTFEQTLKEITRKVANTVYLYKVFWHLLFSNNRVVIIDTIHSVKGMEFDYVFLWDKIPGLVWQALQNDETGEVHLQELMTLYVGITRARKFLGIIKSSPSYFDYFGIYV